MELNDQYWDNRYSEGQTGWDLGGVSTPLKSYFDQMENKDCKILIPGAGNAYEAEYLYRLGFNNVFVADFSPRACQQFHQRVPDFPKSNILCTDFFKLEDQYDLIIEQTFFCALEPALRKKYVQQMYALLKEKGKLVGLLFDDEELVDGPPFGGCKEEYLTLFSKKFDIQIMDSAYNSILPRTGRELFIKLIKH